MSKENKGLDSISNTIGGASGASAARRVPAGSEPTPPAAVTSAPQTLHRTPAQKFARKSKRDNLSPHQNNPTRRRAPSSRCA